MGVVVDSYVRGVSFNLSMQHRLMQDMTPSPPRRCASWQDLQTWNYFFSLYSRAKIESGFLFFSTILISIC
jgi:hypothetical protein